MSLINQHPSEGRHQWHSTTTRISEHDIGSPGHPLRGVSVTHLCSTFLDEVEAAGLSHESLVYQIEEKVIRGKGKGARCPRDGQPGAAYVDTLQSGPGHAGHAQLMLSYTWGYAVGDIVHTLRSLCTRTGRDPAHTFVWICCLCINQHRVQEARAKGDTVPFEQFKAEFESHVCGIGHVVAMMTPWRNPRYLQRVWCVFELFSAVAHEAIEVTVVMTPADVEDMQATLLDAQNLGDLWKALGNVNIEAAHASVEEDKVRILSLIKERLSFPALNAKVSEFLRDWVLRTCELAVTLSTKRGDAANLVHLGVLMTQFGRLDRAEVLYNQARDLCVATGTPETVDGARALFGSGEVKHMRRDLPGALAEYTEARRIHRAAGTSGSPDEARVLGGIGWVNQSQGDLAGALASFTEARRILIATSSLDSSNGARVSGGIGWVNSSQGNLSEALAAFMEERNIHEALGTLETPDGARVFASIGRVKHLEGDLTGAAAAFTETRRIRLATGTLETIEGARMLFGLGRLKQLQGDEIGALVELKEAKRVYATIGILESNQLLCEGTATIRLRDAIAAVSPRAFRAVSDGGVGLPCA